MARAGEARQWTVFPRARAGGGGAVPPVRRLLVTPRPSGSANRAPPASYVAVYTWPGRTGNRRAPTEAGRTRPSRGLRRIASAAGVETGVRRSATSGGGAVRYRLTHPGQPRVVALGRSDRGRGVTSRRRGWPRSASYVVRAARYWARNSVSRWRAPCQVSASWTDRPEDRVRLHAFVEVTNEGLEERHPAGLASSRLGSVGHAPSHRVRRRRPSPPAGISRRACSRSSGRCDRRLGRLVGVSRAGMGIRPAAMPSRA